MALSEDEKDLIEAAAEGATKMLTNKIPTVYTDLFQPGTKVLGKGIEDIVKLALLPVSITVWGYEQFKNLFMPLLVEKLSRVASENIKTPKVNIAGPLLESIKFLGDEPELRDMFAQVLASAMDENKRNRVHPGIVETLKNMSGFDAALLKYMYTHWHFFFFNIEFYIDGMRNVHKYSASPDFIFENNDQLTISLNNLERLGLCKFASHGGEAFEITPEVEEMINKAKDCKMNTIQPSRARITEYGSLFGDICITPIGSSGTYEPAEV